MATIHVRDVSESAVTTLKVRAARADQSLQAYVRQLLESEAAAASPQEAAERARDINLHMYKSVVLAPGPSAPRK